MRGGKTMMFNPYQAQRLAKERVKDAMREAKQARLTRAAKTPRKMGDGGGRCP
jgi:hypothetical protein